MGHILTIEKFLHTGFQHSKEIIDLRDYDFLYNPSPESTKKVTQFLNKNINKHIRLFHGTSPNNKILEQGILTTKPKTKRSYQSETGYVYLSIYPDSAKMFGDMAYGISNAAVYEVIIPIDYLKPDKDQLSNMRIANPDMKIFNSLGDSAVYGHGFRVKGNIPIYMINVYDKPMKESFTYADILEEVLKKYGIIKYKLNEDNSIDVYQDVDIENKDLTEIPFDFNLVDGNFNCGYNNITSLKNSPKKVAGNFYCRNNKLVNLNYSPVYVGKSYDCNNNLLSSLDGCTKIININFVCSKNKITNFLGGPEIVKQHFFSYENKITSLEGLPKIGKEIVITDMEISELGDFLPDETNDDFCINDAEKLISLKGCPSKISGSFYMNNVPNLESLDYFPVLVEEDLFIRGNNYGIEQYPFTIIKGRVTGNDTYDLIAQTIKNNEEKFLPLIEAKDKVRYHQQIMRMLPELIPLYDTIRPPIKASII